MKEQQLNPGENILRRSHLSAWSRAPRIALGVILVPIAIGAIILARVYIEIRKTEILVTSHRFIVRRGWMTVEVEDIPLRKIESVRLRQGFLGSLFGYGDIVVSGTGTTLEPIFGLSEPAELQAAIAAGTAAPS